MTLACNGHVREPAVIESVSITCPLHEWTDCWHVMAAVSSLRLGGEGPAPQTVSTVWLAAGLMRRWPSGEAAGLRAAPTRHGSAPTRLS